MARFQGLRDRMRSASPVARLACAAIALGAIASGVLVGCDWREWRVRSVDRDLIPNRYLVVVRPEKGKPGYDEVRRNPAAYRDDVLSRRQFVQLPRRSFFYNHALTGFAMDMSPQRAEDFDRIDHFEVVQSKRMRLAAAPARPPFGLDRIGQRLLPFDRYYGANLTGEGVHVYVVDTGILESNPEFAGRIGAGEDVIDGSRKDCEGHGTHVAGTIGSTTYGIAKKVTLHSVRVAGCSHITSTDAVIKGLDWIIKNVNAPGIVNLSLSGPRYRELDEAVKRGIAKGLIFIVAAGNVVEDRPNRNACRASPARVRAAITVGAMDPGKDRMAPFSFRGGCVDLFAPGVNILSARNDVHPYGALMDGTSMAAAHATGVAALYLEACKRLNIPTDARDVGKALNFVAGAPGRAQWKGLIKHPWGTPNRLLYWSRTVQPAAGAGSSFPWGQSRPKCVNFSPDS